VLPLAAVGQLTDRMAVTPDLTRAQRALVDASAAVRAYCGQEFSRSITTTRLRLTNGVIRLPQRPVNDVTDVAGADGAVVSFTWDGAQRVYLNTGVEVAPLLPYTPVQMASLVDVTYDHGYDTVPDDIVAVVCNVAARAMGSPPEDAGVATESITNYSVTTGPVGAAGPVGLFEQERMILDRYRRTVGAVWAR
jgi:hypothetical protein